MIRSVQFARGTCRIRRRCRPYPPSIVQQRSSSSTSFSTTTPPTTTPVDDDDISDADSSTIVQGPSLLASTGVHRPSPSLFHLPGLRSLPFWTAPPPAAPSSSSSSEEEGRRGSRQHRIAFNDPIVSSAVTHLESNYDDIRSEYFAAVLGRGMTNAALPQKPLEPDYDVTTRGGEHASDALHTGSWDWHSCVLNGVRNEKFRERCPKTSAVVDDLERKGMLFGTPFGFCFFSTLHARSSIKAHTGPMNLRLRIHLPLVVPTRDDNIGGGGVVDASSGGSGSRGGRPIAGIRVADQVREWREGSALVLDDSYVHEAWNDSDDCSRVVFLLDVWHPDVGVGERERITNMFDYARGKGWIGSSGSGSG